LRSRTRPAMSAMGRARGVLLAGLVALGSFCHAAPAHAHAQPYSFLDLRLETGAIHGRYAAHVFDLAHELGFARPDTLLDLDVARARAPQLIAVLAPRLELSADGAALHPRWRFAGEDREKRCLVFQLDDDWPRTPGTLEVAARMFPYDSQHETYVN